MHKLSIDGILQKIKNGETFSALSENRSFSLTIEEYTPAVCAAIHNGSNFLPELQEKINLSANERWYEEDPFTGYFIEDFPIRIVSYDSRYLYDINRKPEECIYETAWGKTVWKNPLTENEREKLLARHKQFYTVIHALISKINALFSRCIVYDIHSYNYQREGQKSDLPLFNIGTERITEPPFEKYILSWMDELSKIHLPEIENRTARNEVFYGRGYFLEYIMSRFENTLVLATEIKKVYCDENNGNIYPDIIAQLKSGLITAINSHSEKWRKCL